MELFGRVGSAQSSVSTMITGSDAGPSYCIKCGTCLHLEAEVPTAHGPVSQTLKLEKMEQRPSEASRRGHSGTEARANSKRKMILTAKEPEPKTRSPAQGVKTCMILSFPNQKYTS
jgi:hypothetical protein